ncbi:MAG: GtrA family protein [Bacteroidales bacterium]|jgi:putative flippase GtrA|nr:GtrA family protein [Bacteroidales bacterium]
MRRRVEILKKFVMFSLTSVAGTIVDLGLHWALSHFAFDDSYWGSFWIAPTISFEVATLTNFFIAYYLVWRERVSKPGSMRSLFRHLAAYNATCIGGYVLKFIAMQGFHFLFVSLNWLQDWSVEPVFCNLLGLCFSGCFNFVMNEFVIFNKNKVKK